VRVNDTHDKNLHAQNCSNVGEAHGLNFACDAFKLS